MCREEMIMKSILYTKLWFRFGVLSILLFLILLPLASADLNSDKEALLAFAASVQCTPWA